MKIDNLNILIIKTFYELRDGENITLSQLRNRIFPNLPNKNDKKRKVILLRDRIQSMPREIFKIEKNDRISYELQMQNIRFEKIKFPNGIKNAILLFIDGRWRIIEI